MIFAKDNSSKAWLDQCPNCGEDIFEKDADIRGRFLWAEDDEEICKCGAKLQVSIDDSGGCDGDCEEDECSCALASVDWINEDEMAGEEVKP